MNDDPIFGLAPCFEERDAVLHLLLGMYSAVTDVTLLIEESAPEATATWRWRPSR